MATTQSADPNEDVDHPRRYGMPPLMNVTTQPAGVGCYRCALFIEADVERWAPVPKQHWEHDPVSGLTHCVTCGGIDGYPPGC